MWGTGSPEEVAQARLRFIPTHVGNSTLSLSVPVSDSVHPHACGEQCHSSSHPRRMNGSSPRMWGTVHYPCLYPCLTRFIPTHVGNSFRQKQSSACVPVHPHACGEQVCLICRTLRQIGSSPRMWGTAYGCIFGTPVGRFIPTHVGNRRYVRIFDVMGTVHPHACGEQMCLRTAPRPTSGSSPRMWGTAPWSSQDVGGRRFIPTHVGNSTGWKNICCGTSVHPHACGEQTVHHSHCTVRRGSSPRMWGTVDIKGALYGESRFIPTHVGNRKR